MREANKKQMLLLNILLLIAFTACGGGGGGGSSDPGTYYPPVGGGPISGGSTCFTIQNVYQPFPIPVYGSQVLLSTSSYNSGIIIGGRIPVTPGYQNPLAGRDFGNMGVGGGSTQGPYFAAGPEGEVRLTITSINNTSNGSYPAAPGYYPGLNPSQYPFDPNHPNMPGYPGFPGYYPTGGGYNGAYAQRANISGTVYMNPDIMTQIIYEWGGLPPMPVPYGGGYPNDPNFPTNYPMPNTNPICVTSVAMDVKLAGAEIYDGKVYLYINNTNHGVWLYFNGNY